MGLHLKGMHLKGMHLKGMHLMGMHLMRGSHRHVSLSSAQATTCSLGGL
jgi:hypothetical protein